MDGKQVKVEIANHILRAIAFPAGEHTVEFRYESTPLRLGLAISLATFAVLLVVAGYGIWRWMKRRS